MKIGVAGLGAMGAAIATRLIEVGHQVTVWNRSPDKTKPLADAGAKVVGSPAEVAAACEAVITILTDGDAIEAVYSGAKGLLSGERFQTVTSWPTSMSRAAIAAPIAPRPAIPIFMFPPRMLLPATIGDHGAA